jgi:hypothetical protein
MHSLSYRKRLAAHTENQCFFVNETLSAGRYILTISDPFVIFEQSMVHSAAAFPDLRILR